MPEPPIGRARALRALAFGGMCLGSLRYLPRRRRFPDAVLASLPEAAGEAAKGDAAKGEADAENEAGDDPLSGVKVGFRS